MTSINIGLPVEDLRILARKRSPEERRQWLEDLKELEKELDELEREFGSPLNGKKEQQLAGQEGVSEEQK